MVGDVVVSWGGDMVGKSSDDTEVILFQAGTVPKRF
jgi:hypothetical protein